MGKKRKPVSILVTGVPCTGKTTLALEWCAKNDWTYLSLNDLVEQEKLYAGTDQEDMAKLVKLDELEHEANEWIRRQEKSSLIDGHLGCELGLDVDCVLVLRLEPNVLAKRLEGRGYTPSKVNANKMAELLDYCTIRSIRNYGEKNVFELDTSGQDVRGLTSQFEKFIDSGSKGRFRPHVSWSAALLAQV